MIEKALISGTGDPPSALTRAVSRLMRPLVKLLIAHGLTFPVFSKMLKQIYVDVAETEFPLPGKAQTDSRINLLTGVHRKDIRIMRGADHKGLKPSPVVTRNAQMIAIWTGAPDYLDERGNPRPLPRHNSVVDGPSFEKLVGSISKDIRARAILDEWLRLKLVTLDDDQMVHLNSKAFIPRDDFEDLAFYFGRNLRDHIATSAHNLSGDKPRLLDQAVYYTGLSAASVEELERLSRKAGTDALIKINKRAFELADRDRKTGETTRRIRFGVYFYRNNPAPVSDKSASDSGKTANRDETEDKDA